MTELTEVPGVGSVAAKQLKNAYITTAELLAVQNADELNNKVTLGEGTCTNIILAARELLGMFAFKSALEVEKENESKPRLKIGLENVDRQLLGGLEIGSLVEFYGKASGGKTQMCAHLAIRCQLPFDEGGIEGRVIWLDSESSFKTSILRANAKRWGLDPEVALGNIQTMPIVTSYHLEQLFARIPQMCIEQGIKMVVVDSLTGFFRAEHGGLGSLAVRQQRINRLLNLMRRVAMATDVMFVYSNQAISRIGPFPVLNAPVGGHIVSHASDYRFMSTEGKSGKRKLYLKDHAGLANFNVEFSIGWGGFYNDENERKKIEPKIVEYLKSKDISAEIQEKDKKKETKKVKKAEKTKKTKKSKKAEAKAETEVKLEAEVVLKAEG